MTLDKGAQIVERAKEMGAAMAGIASVELLRNSPSYELQRRMGRDTAEIQWPSAARSALVIAVSHPQEEPKLDWWDPVGGSPGNRSLVRINRQVSAWIEETLGLKTHKLSYVAARGGTYLKDAAVIAGLGCIGRNNLLVTPQFGSKVRLRAMLLEQEFAPSGPITFDPCDGCEEPCRKACPQHAFEEPVLSSAEAGVTALPGRDGHFSRPRCMNQMDEDVEQSGVGLSQMEPYPADTEDAAQAVVRVEYCRRCEFACPVGS
jgi:epoxyqueuosine reductase